MSMESIPDSSTIPDGPSVADSSTSADRPTARVKRILDATPEDVFDAWTDPQQARHWMCPVGCMVSELTLEARVGGRLRLVMQVGGKDFIHLGEFLEVERPRRLVFTWITMYTYYRKSVVTVEFAPVEERTELRITHVLLPDEELADAHRKGWEGLLDHLETRLAQRNREPR